MTTNPDLPPELTPEEAALEAELLQRLQPRVLRAGLREEVLEPLLEASDSPEALKTLEHELATRLQVTAPSATTADLWARIESRLEEAPSTEEPEPWDEAMADPGKDTVVRFPQWREFTPIFRMAATIAFGVFIASVWLRPDNTTTPVVNQSPSAGSPLPHPSTRNAPIPDARHVLPIVRHGYVQGSESRGLEKRDNQMYEKFWQKRKDHSTYQFGRDLRVEVEELSEGEIMTPLRTF